MNALGSLFAVQFWLGLIIGLAALAMEVVAFVDCIRRREDAFRAAGKLTKNKWMLITGLAMVLGFMTVQNPLGFLGVIPIVASAVYLVDVRPALQKVLGRPRSGASYGRW